LADTLLHTHNSNGLTLTVKG